MAQQLTYQQLLAEQFEENAKDRLTFQNTLFDEEEDTGAQYDAHVYDRNGVGQELEDQNAYRQFAGNRHLEEDVVKSKAFEDKSKLSVRYNKDVKLNVFNIDSRFRAYAYSGLSTSGQPTSDPTYESPVKSIAVSLASHFVFRPSKVIKNAISVKLTALEMPNTFWNFLASRANTSFRVSANGGLDWYIVTIPDGYYQTADILARAVQSALTDSNNTNLGIRSLPGYSNFTCYVQDTFINIFNTSSTQYTFDFFTSPYSYIKSTTSNNQKQLYQTLGMLLGFPSPLDPTIVYPYLNLNLRINPLVGTYSVDVDPDRYLYLRINDYDSIIPQTTNDTYYSVFAKIAITVTKGLLIIDNSTTNSTSREFKFLQPTNIQQMEVQLLDVSGAEIVFNGNFSMTLEIEEVVSHGLYEKLREL